MRSVVLTDPDEAVCLGVVVDPRRPQQMRRGIVHRTEALTGFPCVNPLYDLVGVPQEPHFTQHKEQLNCLVVDDHFTELTFCDDLNI